MTSSDPSAGENECDYDDPVSLTTIYKEIEARNWPEVISVSKQHPKQARIWISRTDIETGKLRWRLLPLHAAIIFKAPDEVIEELVHSYPKAIETKDDIGMLPIHIGFRNGLTKKSMDLLLSAYPKSVSIKDNKGRFPLDLAQASSSPNKESFVKAIQRGQTYYNMAALATKQAIGMEHEQKAKLGAKIATLEKKQACLIREHECKMLNMTQELKRSTQGYELTIKTLTDTFESVKEKNEELEAELEKEKGAQVGIADAKKKLLAIVDGLKKENLSLKKELKQQQFVAKQKLDSVEEQLNEQKKFE